MSTEVVTNATRKSRGCNEMMDQLKTVVSDGILLNHAERSCQRIEEALNRFQHNLTRRLGILTIIMVVAIVILY